MRTSGASTASGDPRVRAHHARASRVSHLPEIRRRISADPHSPSGAEAAVMLASAKLKHISG
ncbi:hypothetical protein [Oceaniferula marina]|uniref:hypothetical protein n=1 Tax=Oceaniferula marina TaxID=2748318 RepID=UPI001D042C29|nr:hypothetical protein [Oceaniferula marina]